MLAYWGNHTESENAKFSQYLTILKGSALFKEVDGKEITYAHLLSALEGLSNRNELSMIKRLGKEVVVYKDSVDVSKFGTPIYCENHTLSLPRPGTRFAVFDVDLYKADIPSFTTEELTLLCDLCSTFVDLSSYKANGPSDRKMIMNIENRVSELNVGKIAQNVRASVEEEQKRRETK